MNLSIFLIIVLVTSTKAVEDSKGGGHGKAPKMGVGPIDSKDKTSLSSPSHPQNNPKDDDSEATNFKRPTDDDDTMKYTTTTSTYHSGGGISASNKGYDELYFGDDDDDESVGSSSYRTISNKHNNPTKKKQTVEIMFRPYGSACPRVITPSNSKKYSDKEFTLVIFGSSNVDVNTIDGTTIRLSGVNKKKYVYSISSYVADIGRPDTKDSSSSDHCQCSKGSKDGKLDLIVKFMESSVSKIPELAGAEPGDVVKLTVKGLTSSSSQNYIEGQDCIKVV